MAELYFAVYEVAEQTALGDVLQEGTIPIGATSDLSDAIVGTGNKKRTVRLFAGADCFWTSGENPTATDDGLSGRPLGQDNPEYVSIQAGHKIAVIQRL